MHGPAPSHATPGREGRWFTGNTALGVLHGLDDALWHRGAEVPVTQHLLAALLMLGAAVLGVALFGRLRPGGRAFLALAFGALALANGQQHVRHVAQGAPDGGDLTGVLAALAGVALLGLAVWIPVRHRRRPVRRRTRAGAVVLGLVAAYAVLLPLAVAVVALHPLREAVGAPPSAAFRPVSFPSTDGLRLSGWYVPSRNRAAVLVVHGGGGTRRGSLAHARLLSRRGFGVLVYDARGRGRSEGAPNPFGWGWERDVAGAVAFLGRRPDVDRERVGALGLSTGADVLIRVAARPDDGVRAVVGDGATAASLADVRDAGVSPVDLPYWAVLYGAARVLSGAPQSPPLAELVARVAPTPLLLVSAGAPASEGRMNRVYAAAARRPFTLWELHGVAHTGAIRERPAEYEDRVLGFFARWLRGPATQPAGRRAR